MSSESWKLEKDLCRCCHSEGSFKNLAEPAQSAGLSEIYADMLNECFDIDMAPVPGLLSAATYTICEICVIRLRDASEFKKQVLSCEERFKDLYNRNIIRASAPTALVDVEVKQEIPEAETEPHETFKVELSQDENDDEDYNDSMDLQLSEEEEEVKPTKVEATKKRKCKTKKAVKCKPAKKTKAKTKSVKVDPTLVDDENDAEKKQGSTLGSSTNSKDTYDVEEWAKQGKQVKPRFMLKINEHYTVVDGKYCCVQCDKTYNKLESMRGHLKIKHYTVLKYKCTICTDAFALLTPLVIHTLETHNVDLRKMCTTCGKYFYTNIHLNRHIKNVHLLGEDGKRYKCEFCDFETLLGKALARHMFKHKAESFQCGVCQKSFRRKTNLRLHERIHTNDRRKVCAICGQAFVQKASLNYHMTKYHPDVRF